MQSLLTVALVLLFAGGCCALSSRAANTTCSLGDNPQYPYSVLTVYGGKSCSGKSTWSVWTAAPAGSCTPNASSTCSGGSRAACSNCRVDVAPVSGYIALYSFVDLCVGQTPTSAIYALPGSCVPNGVGGSYAKLGAAWTLEKQMTFQLFSDAKCTKPLSDSVYSVEDSLCTDMKGVAFGNFVLAYVPNEKSVKSKLTPGQIAGIVLAAIAAVVLLVTGALCVWKRKNSPQSYEQF